MSITHDRAKELALSIKNLSTRAVNLLADIEQINDLNSDLAIDWANASKPAFLNEDAAGNIDGTQFTRQQLSDAIGSLYQIKQLFRAQVPTDGDHLGTLNALADIPVE